MNEAKIISALHDRSRSRLNESAGVDDPKKVEEPSNGTVDGDEEIGFIKCPNCGTKNEVENEVCVKCGTDLLALRDKEGESDDKGSVDEMVSNKFSGSPTKLAKSDNVELIVDDEIDDESDDDEIEIVYMDSIGEGDVASMGLDHEEDPDLGDGFIDAEGGVTDSEFEDDEYFNEYIYQCPNCEEYFDSGFEIIGEVVCPNCFATVTPMYQGELEDVAESMRLNEVTIRVSGGKVIKMKKPKKKGYKRVKGKYVKMSSKEKRARVKSIKKAQKKSRTSTAKKKRARSMKVRRKKKLNDSLFRDLINTAADSISESIHNSKTSEVHKVTGCQYDEEKGDLVIEAVIKRNGQFSPRKAKFIIESFVMESGTYRMIDTHNALGVGRKSIDIDIEVEEDQLTFEGISFELRDGDKVLLRESFIVEE